MYNSFLPEVVRERNREGYGCIARELKIVERLVQIRTQRNTCRTVIRFKVNPINNTDADLCISHAEEYFNHGLRYGMRPNTN